MLEVFNPEQPFLGVTDLAAKLELSKTTVFRIAHTLNNLGYVKYDSNRRKYYPGPRILGMGFATLMSMKIREIAKPYMEELSKVLGENVNLGILDGYEIVYVEQVKSQQILDVKLYVGSRVPIYNTAMGRVVLAYLPSEKLNEILHKIGAIPDARRFLGLKSKKILGILEKVRIKGYAINNEEWESGIRAVAAPILNRKGLLEGGINVSVLSAKVSLNTLESRYGPLLIKTAASISSSLG